MNSGFGRDYPQCHICKDFGHRETAHVFVEIALGADRKSCGFVLGKARPFLQNREHVFCGVVMDQLQSMRAFIAVAKYQSFTKAADLLNVSRPMLSRSISDLETHVGTRLLNRTTRKVKLADGAKEYFDSCVRIIDLIDEAEHRLNDDNTSECGPIRVIVHPLAVASGISTVLDAFSATSPCVKLQVTMQDGPLNLVESGYDVSIYPPDLVLNSTVVNRALFSSGYVLVASEAYLNKAAPVRSLRDLCEHRIVDGREAGSDHKDSRVLDDQTCPDSLSVPHFRVTGLVAKELALTGTGIALLPETAIAGELSRGLLVRIELDNAPSLGHIALGVQYQRIASNARRVRTFIDACVSYFRAIGETKTRNAYELA
jgi:DNA-binding transcriptional LysR family regulator